MLMLCGWLVHTSGTARHAERSPRSPAVEAEDRPTASWRSAIVDDTAACTITVTARQLHHCSSASPRRLHTWLTFTQLLAGILRRRSGGQPAVTWLSTAGHLPDVLQRIAHLSLTPICPCFTYLVLDPGLSAPFGQQKTSSFIFQRGTLNTVTWITIFLYLTLFGEVGSIINGNFGGTRSCQD